MRLCVDCVWNVMAHAQKTDIFFRRNGRVHLNRRGRQFSRLLAAEVCASAVVMLDTPCPEVVWRVLATHSIRQFPLHFPSRASPCVITFQLDSTYCGQYVAQWVQWGYRLDLCVETRFFSSSERPESLVFSGYVRRSSRIKRPWRKANRSPPFSVEVRAWNLSTTLCWVEQRGIFSYFYKIIIIIIIICWWN
jgi:hypothetical protein